MDIGVTSLPIFVFFWAEENQPKCYRNPPEKAKKNVVRRGPPGPSRATFFFGFSGGHPCSIQRSLASLGTLNMFSQPFF